MAIDYSDTSLIQDMLSMINRLEDENQRENLSLEEGLLIASGVRNDDELELYKFKLEMLKNRFESEYGEFSDEFDIGKKLLKFIHTNRNKIYEGVQFRITEAIDNLLFGNDECSIGNCLSLSSLYAALGDKLGLDMRVYYQKGNKEEPGHVLIKLLGEEYSIDPYCFAAVETTLPNGFNVYRRQLDQYFSGLERNPTESIMQLVKMGYDGFMITANKFLEKRHEDIEDMISCEDMT